MRHYFSIYVRFIHLGAYYERTEGDMKCFFAVYHLGVLVGEVLGEVCRALSDPTDPG